ncbi:MAG: ParB/RepB/Spo0J family partition protein [Eubacteriales bacterium]
MNSGLLEKYNRRLLDLPVECIVASPTQPRTDFDPEALDGLCESIKNIGIIQPLTVRYRGEGTYELIAGERRLRAAKRNEMRHVPCIIADVDDTSSALITLVENLQRRDLSFFEEAKGLDDLIRLSGMTQQQAAEKTGKTQSSVANKLRLLRLPDKVRTAITEANLTERHARALLSLTDEDKMLCAVAAAKKNGWNVAEFEQYLAVLQCPPKKKPRRIGFCRDLRLYSNSFTRTVKMMRDSGFAAKMQTEELDDCVRYTITVTRKH